MYWDRSCQDRGVQASLSGSENRLQNQRMALRMLIGKAKRSLAWSIQARGGIRNFPPVGLEPHVSVGQLKNSLMEVHV